MIDTINDGTQCIATYEGSVYVTRPAKINHVSTKLHQVIFLAISLALNVISHFCKFQKKAH